MTSRALACMYSVRYSNKTTFRKVTLLRLAKLPGATGGEEPKRGQFRWASFGHRKSLGLCGSSSRTCQWSVFASQSTQLCHPVFHSEYCFVRLLEDFSRAMKDGWHRRLAARRDRTPSMGCTLHINGPLISSYGKCNHLGLKTGVLSLLWAFPLNSRQCYHRHY